MLGAHEDDATTRTTRSAGADDPAGSRPTSGTVVLVHGAWHGSWCWNRLVPELEARGLAVALVDLPSSGPDVDALGDLYADVDAVTAVLDAVTGPKVVVAHSYGGMPVTDATAGRDDVSHLVYVCAFMLDEGVSLWDAAGGQPVPWWRISDDGRWMTADRPEYQFYSDCDPADGVTAVARLEPQSMSSIRQPLRGAGWQTIPSTYVVADLDTNLPQVVQEGMATGRASRVLHIDTGHSPFLNQPAELAAIVADCTSWVGTPAAAD